MPEKALATNQKVQRLSASGSTSLRKCPRYLLSEPPELGQTAFPTSLVRPSLYPFLTETPLDRPRIRPHCEVQGGRCLFVTLKISIVLIQNAQQKG